MRAGSVKFHPPLVGGSAPHHQRLALPTGAGLLDQRHQSAIGQRVHRTTDLTVAAAQSLRQLDHGYSPGISLYRQLHQLAENDALRSADARLIG